MRVAKRRGCIATLLDLVILCLVVVYGAPAITAPWSFHIGGPRYRCYPDRPPLDPGSYSDFKAACADAPR